MCGYNFVLPDLENPDVAAPSFEGAKSKDDISNLGCPFFQYFPEGSRTLRDGPIKEISTSCQNMVHVHQLSIKLLFTDPSLKTTGRVPIGQFYQ
jgi:hypothetical protein